MAAQSALEWIAMFEGPVGFIYYVPCNLGTCARNLEITLRILGISKLCADLEIAQPILRLRFAQSQDCASAICKHN